jgi:hypothetical protein
VVGKGVLVAVGLGMVVAVGGIVVGRWETAVAEGSAAGAQALRSGERMIAPPARMDFRQNSRRFMMMQLSVENCQLSIVKVTKRQVAGGRYDARYHLALHALHVLYAAGMMQDTILRYMRYMRYMCYMRQV